MKYRKRKKRARSKKKKKKKKMVKEVSSVPTGTLQLVSWLVSFLGNRSKDFLALAHEVRPL